MITVPVLLENGKYTLPPSKKLDVVIVLDYGLEALQVLLEAKDEIFKATASPGVGKKIVMVTGTDREPDYAIEGYEIRTCTLLVRLKDMRPKYRLSYYGIATVLLQPAWLYYGTLNLKALATFDHELLELSAHTVRWLAFENISWLDGKFADAAWDMEELAARKEEIVFEGVLGLDSDGR
ncbi:hypothetical protein BU26DRAFT_603438 [Trematosphaeria pertusa]|uniref:Uncharacterized protein n=1 Tax=Trematosphaeria pertusa TaxID=390896 RepID=A0A6A6IK04_9PLEO|nr:uncharacterized protein BU26DRAFT_603438 [Trematosphaeria pertusa]KAF2250914.1 hypothetical protein BU26DRAFT_603438 [Trematosphaeria pertusa]